MENQSRSKTKYHKLAVCSNFCPSNDDRISCLPIDILLSILSYLPLREAARTTILSKTWRPLFRVIPHLIFDDGITHYGENPKIGIKDVESCWLDVVNTVLCSRGTLPIKTCEIEVAMFSFDDDNGSDEIFRHICSDGLKELSVQLFRNEMHIFSVPFHVFSCHSLVRLEIHGCEMTLPESFEGLHCLKSLLLDLVETTREEFEHLVSRCGVLKELFLSKIFCLHNVKICSQSLSLLQVSNPFPLGILPKGAVCLKNVVTNIYGDPIKYVDDYESTLMFDFLMELCHVEHLTLQLPKGFSENLKETIPETSLQKLQLTSLKKLVEGDREKHLHKTEKLSCYWEERRPAECVLHHLKHVQMYCVNYDSVQCLDFVFFLLRNGKMLQKITILGYPRNSVLHEQLLLLQSMASSIVVIELKPSKYHRIRISENQPLCGSVMKSNW